MRSAFTLLFPLTIVVGIAVAIYVFDPFGGPARPEKVVLAEPPPGLAQATFGAGCFWCTEAVFQELKGVKSVIPGYCGGTVKNPTYRQVCTGTTGHAEAVQVTYDPAVISYEDLLEAFWQTHDPTTRDRQGNDRGPQYRSVIFYHTEDQKRQAEQSKQKLDASGQLPGPVVTEIVAFSTFYTAEAEHQDYFAQHPWQPYCGAIIRPKVEKVRKAMPDKLATPSERH